MPRLGNIDPPRTVTLTGTQSWVTAPVQGRATSWLCAGGGSASRQSCICGGATGMTTLPGVLVVPAQDQPLACGDEHGEMTIPVPSFGALLPMPFESVEAHAVTRESNRMPEAIGTDC